MAKALDFNSIQRPTLDLTMKDEARTKIHVSAPKEALIEKLQTVSGELEEVFKSGDGRSIKAVFDLASDLISCNRDYTTVTAEDLRDKYGMDLEDMIIFFSAYLDFINEIQNAKN